MGGGKINFTFLVCMVSTKFGAKIQKSSHIRNTYTQKFTNCKVLGANFYELQSFLPQCVNFYTRGRRGRAHGSINRVNRKCAAPEPNGSCAQVPVCRSVSKLPYRPPCPRPQSMALIGIDGLHPKIRDCIPHKNKENNHAVRWIY